MWSFKDGGNPSHVHGFTVLGKPLVCLVCGGNDFSTHEGLKESRASAFWGFSWAREGVDKVTCLRCGLTLTFARVGGLAKSP